MSFEGLYYGTVDEVIAPNHKSNRSKSTYEYMVILTHDRAAQIPVHCVKMDPFGSPHNFEDSILSQGCRVLVMFPRGESAVGTIIGGYRSTVKKPVKSEEGFHHRQRFNEIETYIDNKGAWHVTSDDGPNANISKTQIILDDSVGEKITLDKTTKTLTIETKELKVFVKGNAEIVVDQNVNVVVHGQANIRVDGDVTADCNNLKVNTRGQADVTVANDANVKAKNINVTAKGTAKVDAKSIELNGSGGQVLTTKTSPIVDYITGILTEGIPNVSGGA